MQTSTDKHGSPTRLWGRAAKEATWPSSYQSYQIKNKLEKKWEDSTGSKYTIREGELRKARLERTAQAQGTQLWGLSKAANGARRIRLLFLGCRLVCSTSASPREPGRHPRGSWQAVTGTMQTPEGKQSRNLFQVASGPRPWSPVSPGWRSVGCPAPAPAWGNHWRRLQWTAPSSGNKGF